MLGAVSSKAIAKTSRRSPACKTECISLDCGMSYKSLRDFLARLEKDGELIRVKEPVSTVLEMTEIQTRLIAQGGPAVIFEKPVKADGAPSPMPVLVNLFGTVKRVAMGVTMGGK